MRVNRRHCRRVPGLRIVEETPLGAQVDVAYARVALAQAGAEGQGCASATATVLQLAPPSELAAKLRELDVHRRTWRRVPASKT